MSETNETTRRHNDNKDGAGTTLEQPSKNLLVSEIITRVFSSAAAVTGIPGRGAVMSQHNVYPMMRYLFQTKDHAASQDFRSHFPTDDVGANLGEYKK